MELCHLGLFSKESSSDPSEAPSRSEVSTGDEDPVEGRSSASTVNDPVKRSKWFEEEKDDDGAERRQKKKNKSKLPVVHKGPVIPAKVVIESATPSEVSTPTPAAVGTPEWAGSRSPNPHESQPEPQGPVYTPPTSKMRQIQESAPPIEGCRNLSKYEILNKIDEGAYGVVFRGRDRVTNKIVALKKLKMEKEKVPPPPLSLLSRCSPN